VESAPAPPTVVVAEPGKGRGRPATGKRSNPEWKLYSHFLKRKTQRAAVARLQAGNQTVQLNVRQALINLISAYAALDQTSAELKNAQSVLLSTQAQYRAGVTTLPLLLNAQVGITTALTAEVTAAYAIRQAEQALLFAEGANAAG